MALSSKLSLCDGGKQHKLLQAWSTFKVILDINVIFLVFICKSVLDSWVRKQNLSSLCKVPLRKQCQEWSVAFLIYTNILLKSKVSEQCTNFHLFIFIQQMYRAGLKMSFFCCPTRNGSISMHVSFIGMLLLTMNHCNDKTLLSSQFFSHFAVYLSKIHPQFCYKCSVENHTKALPKPW